jgi:excisionase family DNA binding protein
VRSPAKSRRHTAPPPPEPGPVYSVLEQVERHHGVLKAADLAKILGVHRQTVYEMMTDGRIPTIQDGLNSKRVDPKTFAFVLRKKNPMMREAARQG